MSVGVCSGGPEHKGHTTAGDSYYLSLQPVLRKKLLDTLESIGVPQNLNLARKTLESHRSHLLQMNFGVLQISLATDELGVPKRSIPIPEKRMEFP